MGSRLMRHRRTELVFLQRGWKSRFFCQLPTLKSSLLSLLIPATHRAADERIAVPSEKQGLGFEEETGHPFPRGQRDLP